MSDPRDALERAAAWLWRRTDRRGALACAKHRVEHTGKNASAMLLETRLFEEGLGDRYLDRAILRARRVLSRLRHDPAAGAMIFWPGRLHAWNAATTLIDGGSCARALARLWERHRDALGAPLAREAEEGLRRHLDEYLCNAVRVKEVPAQQLWGATGLAAAARALDVAAWREAALEGVGRGLAGQASDGSFAYYPKWKEYGAAAGLADPSSFYQSRHLGFALAVLDDLGVALEGDRRERVHRGLSFLAALERGNGIKELAVEAKTYYWEGPYEVASHVFDVHALAMWRRATGDRTFEGLERRLLESWIRHVGPDGEVRSHRAGPVRDFQCPVFWAAHACWVAEVWREAPQAPSTAGSQAAAPSAAVVSGSEPEGGGEGAPAGVPRASPRVRLFPEAGLARIEGRGWVALLRGRKHPVSLNAGGAGGGGILSVTGTGRGGRGAGGGGAGGWGAGGGGAGRWRVRGWEARVPATFVLRPARSRGILARWRAFRRANPGELRFRLWVAKGELRAMRPGAFLFQLCRRAILRALEGVWSDAHTTHWALDAGLEVEAGELHARCVPANRWGERLEGVVVLRRYRADRCGLAVTEELRAAPGALRSCRYLLPPGARDVEVQGDVVVEAPWRAARPAPGEGPESPVPAASERPRDSHPAGEMGPRGSGPRDARPEEGDPPVRARIHYRVVPDPV